MTDVSIAAVACNSSPRAGMDISQALRVSFFGVYVGESLFLSYVVDNPGFCEVAGFGHGRDLFRMVGLD